MQHAVTVVHPQKWAQRAFFIDVLACGILLIAGAFLLVDTFIVGRNPFAPNALLRIALEAVLLIVAFAWIAFRLLRAGYVNATRPHS